MEENLNKLELISTLKEHANLSKAETVNVIERFFGKMADTLARGDRMEIRGLCSFYVKEYESYVSRNPKTGEKVPIEPKKLPFFKAGKELKKRVNR